MRKLLPLLVLGCLIGAVEDAEARDSIKIVGSSTVYPFTVAVINKLEESKDLDVDITATGTGGGFLLFCTGSGGTWPDLAGASRPIKDHERKRCARNGVTEITEIQIGYDGIVVANAAGAPTLAFSRKDLFLALAASALVDDKIVSNPITSWKQVNSSFPDTDIKVIGPPQSSGTRDNFESMVMLRGCTELSDIGAVDEADRDEFCATIRGEPQYVEGGEDDLVIVERLVKEPKSFGIFGFSFAGENPERVKANPIDGVMPTAATIADGSYPLARPLYLYVKNNRVADVPALEQLLAEYASEAAIGADSYLVDRGLVPLSDDERAASMTKVKSLIGN